MNHPSFLLKIFDSRSAKLKISAITSLALIFSAIGQQTSAIANTDTLEAPSTSENVDAAPQAAPVVPDALKPVPVEPVRIAPSVPVQRPAVSLTTPVKPPIVKPVLEIPKNHNTTLPTIAPQQAASGKNNFIDNKVYTPPATVVVTERARGCQTIATSGQVINGNCNVRPAPVARQTAPATREAAPQMARRPLPPVNLVARQNRPSVTRQPVTIAAAPVVVQRRPVVQNMIGTVATNVVNNVTRLTPPTVAASSVVALNPQSWNGARLALQPVAPTTDNSNEPARYDRAATMGVSKPVAAARTDLLFPLALPAPITSVFGWRNHPVTGNLSRHEGTDLGAPLGTPVLAAYRGEVAAADWIGGYGLTVILRHLDGTQESRYGHLSEITVKPGQWVEQGEVIGKVGSTGLSTGPHLHFEWRHNTAQGWVAVDAGVHLEYALENLVQRMQMAQENSEPQG